MTKRFNPHPYPRVIIAYSPSARRIHGGFVFFGNLAKGERLLLREIFPFPHLCFESAIEGLGLAFRGQKPTD